MNNNPLGQLPSHWISVANEGKPAPLPSVDAEEGKVSSAETHHKRFGMKRAFLIRDNRLGTLHPQCSRQVAFPFPHRKSEGADDNGRIMESATTVAAP
ncbi:hypothetical protein [Aggregatilinea lenta]|uniref:hypothetical protein n=1 Tax=Aggregatilinea lenta TaxID=913108 RepID=UPI0013C35F5C|nr:hypothetical protein [Aggregatilinea lenta]